MRVRVERDLGDMCVLVTRTDGSTIRHLCLIQGPGRFSRRTAKRFARHLRWTGADM